MAKYRKKPVVIEAVQWFPDEKLGVFHGLKYENRGTGNDKHGVEYTVCGVGLHTHSGFAVIRPGDWIIRGVEGERYPCKRSVFEATYEREKGE